VTDAQSWVMHLFVTVRKASAMLAVLKQAAHFADCAPRVTRRLSFMPRACLGIFLVVSASDEKLKGPLAVGPAAAAAVEWKRFGWASGDWERDRERQNVFSPVAGCSKLQI